MPKFGDRLSEQDVEDIRKYILTKAREKKQELKDDTRYRKEDEQ
jgi:mono/diheme cytochrome c family protein